MTKKKAEKLIQKMSKALDSIPKVPNMHWVHCTTMNEEGNFIKKKFKIKIPKSRYVQIVTTHKAGGSISGVTMVPAPDPKVKRK